MTQHLFPFEVRAIRDLVRNGQRAPNDMVLALCDTLLSTSDFATKVADDKLAILRQSAEAIERFRAEYNVIKKHMTPEQLTAAKAEWDGLNPHK